MIAFAAGPSKPYLMTSNNAKGIILTKHPILTETFDRGNLGVEGECSSFHHMTAMLDALAADDETDAELEHTADGRCPSSAQCWAGQPLVSKYRSDSSLP